MFRLRRLLASSTYAISGTLAGLALKLENIIEQHQEQNSIDTELGLNLLGIQDNFETYDELSDEWDGDEEDSKKEKVYSQADIENMRQEIVSLKEFASLAQSIQKNSKGEKVLKEINLLEQLKESVDRLAKSIEKQNIIKKDQNIDSDNRPFVAPKTYVQSRF